MVVLGEHLAQSACGSHVARPFKLVRKEGRIVAHLVNIETKGPTDDTEQLREETEFGGHETIVSRDETGCQDPANAACRLNHRRDQPPIERPARQPAARVHVLEKSAAFGSSSPPAST